MKSLQLIVVADSPHFYVYFTTIFHTYKNTLLRKDKKCVNLNDDFPVYFYTTYFQYL